MIKIYFFINLLFCSKIICSFKKKDFLEVKIIDPIIATNKIKLKIISVKKLFSYNSKDKIFILLLSNKILKKFI